MWKLIPDWPGYRVCACGAVISEKRGTARLLRTFARGRMGHLGVNLCRGGLSTMKMHSVHRLVAAAFLPPPRPDETVVMHLDDDPTNNAASNLAWGTPAANSAQMIAHERQARGEQVGGAKLTAGEVLEMRRLHADEGIGSRRLARMFAVSRNTANDIVMRRHWRHV